ncbi:MAG: SMP-30/gluconolactonase/LRE family protein [Bryobacteraceae bacterium]
MFLALLAAAAFTSSKAPADADPSADPNSAFWNGAPAIVIESDYSGAPVSGHRTEVRSRWTPQHLYLLYICQYEALNLKPDPNTTAETPRLWNWDVGEAFIGADAADITRYREFQVSPQGEWVDLDIDRSGQRRSAGAAWNSGIQVKARIDANRKIWFGEMKIPFTALGDAAPAAGRELRAGFFRIAGVDPNKKFISWQATDGKSFHVPDKFGTLRLVEEAPSPKVEKVASGFPGGEGPVWSRDGYLLFSDYENSVINRYEPGKGVTVFRAGSNGANGNTLDRKGRLYTCEYRSRRVTRTSKSGKIEVLADKFEGKRFNAPNDIVVRRDGHVYFTDPLFTPLDKRDLDFYGVYHMTPKGKLELVAKPKGRPNGIALSPDGRILYVANTDEQNIRAYDVDGLGRASNERMLIEKLPSRPDGFRVDVKGNLYITGRNISIYSAKGEPIGLIPLPESARNCAFGGPDFRTLYITGRDSLWSVRLDTPGSVQY